MKIGENQMEENNMNVLLMDKLAELNKLETDKSKILGVIFVKTTKGIMNKKIQSLESNFEEQSKYYDQNLEDYSDIYNEIMEKYKEQLSQIIDKYNELYINMQLELQEAECNQKIAITNLKKSFDIKQEISDRAQNEIIEEYNKKIAACMQKKVNYDIIIEECEKELDKCASNMQNRINALFSDKSSQISLIEEKGLKKLIKKIKNKFTGARKFNTYVIEPLNIEIDMMDSKLPDITNNIKQETINFVAKMKQAKDETNQIFEDMIKMG